MTIPPALIAQAKTTFDLTEPADRNSLYHLTELLLQVPGLSLNVLKHVARKTDTPLEFKIAVKLVESKKFLLGNKQPVKIGVVFAMWGEQHRLYPKNQSNPHGEDLLRVKLEQLDWAAQNSAIDWTLYAVDDGCPYNSGQIAAEIAHSPIYYPHLLRPAFAPN